MYYKVAPSLLAADFTRLGSQVQEVREAGAEYIHLDVMDGAFVPSISFGMPVLKSLRKASDIVFDVHMMVEEPGRYVEDIKKSGADIITVHAEACTHLDRVVNQIKETGCRAGVALNPATPVSVLDCILDQLDMVLIMTVNPGFGGQKFIPYTLNKVRALRQTVKERGLKTDIQVDGGVSIANVREILEAGANIFVAGSAVFGTDPAARTREFVELFKEYEK
ncbi:ribulose-phosphate 3-epimerase [Lacrimispora sp. 210928-DFI.3.58]|uniref:ribulose-phosphate 3-epimerase n=1 Tax=Lacrimispora sp. 210928-DFI.3.58 TaxID=2883214 RepID=UPI001D0999F6|nr:ribulose-phosphate 3-epimerase [Lacrimispora sp. 210928-DFI.3.58]MCB7319738.1 ribulose-phosphate 3-epimerase [Lacrimispora sp. 210928-DFI.3.58]